MTSMIIEYDLRSSGRNYDELYKTIKSYSTWAHVTESTWFIKTSESWMNDTHEFSTIFSTFV